MAKAKTKAAGTNLPVPQSDAEAEQLIAQLGALQRDNTEAQARHNASVAALETKRGTAVKDFQQRETAIVEALAIWASAHRERLTGGGKSKTVQLASGTILWREGRYAVKHRPLKNDEVVEAIRERIAQLDEELKVHRKARRNLEAAACRAKIEQLEGFLRTKVEPNKEAMLASPEARLLAETVRGVTVPRGPEEFGVEPLASQIREVA